MVNRANYISDPEWIEFLDYSRSLETPFVVVNLKKIQQNYQRMTDLFPYGKVYYAIKANPHIEVVKRLVELGSCFDLASRPELDRVLSLGVTPDRLSYGNTIKKARDIAYFYEKGVRLFATDSDADLQNIANHAPGSKVYARILMQSSSTSDWPLSRKFGVGVDMVWDLLVRSRKLGLIPFGISFHVGSQQKDIGQWSDAIAKVKYLFATLEAEEGISLQMINLGGGLPTNYLHPVNPIETYASEIKKYLDDNFETLPQVILEPGRSLVGNAGILGTEVVLISRKSHTALNRWIYLDAGVFNGLPETIGESIKYPIVTEHHEDSEKTPAIICGNTCDSLDICYYDYKPRIPDSLQIGERLYFLSTGAYTSSYASVEFNGFEPIKTYILK